MQEAVSLVPIVPRNGPSVPLPDKTITGTARIDTLGVPTERPPVGELTRIPSPVPLLMTTALLETVTITCRQVGTRSVRIGVGDITSTYLPTTLDVPDLAGRLPICLPSTPPSFVQTFSSLRPTGGSLSPPEYFA